MRHTLIHTLSYTLLYITAAIATAACSGRPEFVTARDGRFFVGEDEYRFIGANIRYDTHAGSDNDGRARLAAMLDELHEAGVSNVRVPVDIDCHDSLYTSMDVLMDELEKRDMKAVLYFDREVVWRDSCNNDSLLATDDAHIRNVVGRVSTVSQKPYAAMEALMAWELASETRCEARDSTCRAAFTSWIDRQAQLIKSIDANHLVTTASPGTTGCGGSSKLYEAMHKPDGIDYATIHLWPYEWQWLGDDSLSLTDDTDPLVRRVGTACSNAFEYIDYNLECAARIGKPVVADAFGYPRDRASVQPYATTNGRDAFCQFVHSIVSEQHMMSGCNIYFWNFASTRRPKENATRNDSTYAIASTDETTLWAVRQGSKSLNIK